MRGNSIDTHKMCPANLLSTTTEKIQDTAIMAHKSLGLRHYSSSDFILSKRGLYLLETNSLPALIEGSLLQKSLDAGGVGLSDFLDYVVTLTLERG